jgi:hypothetical protein
VNAGVLAGYDLALVNIGGIALVLQPSRKWINEQLLQMKGGAHQNSLKVQYRRNCCADYVLEPDSISQSYYSYCEEFWKD